MHYSLVQGLLRNISKTCRRILDDSSLNIVIPQAIEMVEVTFNSYEYAKRNQTRGYNPAPWGYAIDHSQPLRFRPSNALGGIRLQVDVYCDIRWRDKDLPETQDIKVRIWSEDDPIRFDEERDAQKILAQLTDPARNRSDRVISRFHFDKTNQNQQSGPLYHLQIGGIPHDYELCWHPKGVNTPRLGYHPMELLLTCQMIAANFFWTDYLEIREKSEWRTEVKHFERLLLKDYFKRCYDAIDSAESLFDDLWVS